jgi:hypothetical protein
LFAFQRCVSRLLQMQSSGWVGLMETDDMQTSPNGK